MHVDCLMEEAVSRQAHRGRLGSSEFPTCTQLFTRAIKSDCGEMVIAGVHSAESDVKRDKHSGR